MNTKSAEPAERFLLLVRHGIAEDPRPGCPDSDRALTEEGWKKTRAAMRGLVKTGWIPDAAFASPYRRAAETLSCLTGAVLKRGLDAFPAGTWEGCVPEADPVKAEAWLLKHMAAAKPGATLAIVSHQPFLGELIYRLTGDNIEIKKASCTMVAWKGGKWTLLGHFGPADLRAMD